MARGRDVSGESEEQGGEGQPQGWNQAVSRPRGRCAQAHQRHRRSCGRPLLRGAAVESTVLASRIGNRCMGWGIRWQYAGHLPTDCRSPTCECYRAIGLFVRTIRDDVAGRGQSREMPMTMHGTRVRGDLNSPRCIRVRMPDPIRSGTAVVAEERADTRRLNSMARPWFRAMVTLGKPAIAQRFFRFQ